MFCDPISASTLDNKESTSSPRKMTEVESRKQILASYEKKGVDLPIVTLEMVLDRASSATDDGVESNSNMPNKKKKNNVFGRFAKSEVPKPEAFMDTLQQSQQESVKAIVAERRSATNKGDEENALVQGEEVAPTKDQLQQNNAAWGILCYPQPHSTVQNRKIANTLDDAEADGTVASTAVPESKRSSNSSDIFCCTRNQTIDENSPYIKSNLQLPEGTEDNNDTQYQEIMQKGSLIDADESIMTSNADYEDEIPHTYQDISKEVEPFWGSRRFQWTMMLCFLLHAVVISLIIVVALNARKNLSGR